MLIEMVFMWFISNLQEEHTRHTLIQDIRSAKTRNKLLVVTIGLIREPLTPTIRSEETAQLLLRNILKKDE